MMLDDITNKVIMAAYNEAKNNNHEYMTPEHILFSSLFFKEGFEIIENSGGDVEELKKGLVKFFKNSVPIVKNKEPEQTLGVNNIIQNAATHCYSSGKELIRIGDILVAIFDEEESYARYLLLKSGISKLDVLDYISHGLSSLIPTKSDTLSPYLKEEPTDTDKNRKNADENKKEDKKENKFLKAFTTNLVKKAEEGRIDPLIGRESIVRRTLQVLARRVKNNPIHVGDPGVGKTAITEGLAKLISDNKAPKSLKNSQIYCLDMGSLVAGTKYRGDFEERIKKVLLELEKIDDVIVYIDEIHTVIGAGAVSGGSIDASNILKPFLSNGKIKFIGSTTYEEYKKYFEKDRALSRRFQKIEILEPTVEETIDILKGLKDRYEEFHKIKYTDESIKLAVELSSKYINDRYLPDKAIDVLDESAANVKLLNEEEEDDDLRVSSKDIEETISLMAKIPKQSVSSNEIEKLKDLDKKIKENLFGQDKAIDTVVKAIKRTRAGFHDGEKPIASLLFVGPTGVGKTELARLLADIFGISLIRFDMSEYQEKHTVARLIGAPPGYVGFEEGGQLTETIKKTPYCVLLLDEIEKAHSDIFNVLLQVMDYATLTDNNGKKTDFRNVIIIMTSNAGAREVGKNTIGFGSSKINSDAIKGEVERVFAPEFRNRLDDIVLFNGINISMSELIVKKAFKQFEEKLVIKNIKIEVSDECYEWFANKGLSSIFGAREILRLVQEKIKNYFVDEVLFGKFSKGGTAIIYIKDDEVVIKRKDETDK
ncbi:MAG: ATP-dependent Clp protease ATP-binding subunit ClpA [Clostridiales bacterium]